MARGAVLGLLYGHPVQELHLREIARRTGLAPATVQREVQLLASAGILERRRDGQQVYYSANAAWPAFQELRGLVLKTVGLADIIRGALAPLADRVVAAFVYGSMADGTFTGESDIDLMVVGDIPLRELARALRPLREALGRQVNPVAIRPSELHARVRAGDHFMMTVLRGARIDLIGDSDDLERPAARSSATGTQDVTRRDR